MMSSPPVNRVDTAAPVDDGATLRQSPPSFRKTSGAPPNNVQDEKLGFMSRVSDFLPDWLVASLKDRRKWKNFIRCLIATLAAMVLVLDQNCGLCDCRLWAHP